MLTYPSAITGPCRMLPLLLLPLFIASLPTSMPKPCPFTHEFRVELKIWNNIVQNCPDNCSSAHITDAACQCFNLNMSLEDTACKCFNLSASQKECDSPGIAIKALESVHHSNSTEEAIDNMIKGLKRSECQIKTSLCLPSGKVSPKKLHDELARWMERYSSEQ